MSPETLQTIEKTTNDQLKASLNWESYLLLGRNIGSTIPHEIGMTLRNPAIYHDSLTNKELDLPESMTERWEEIRELASFLCKRSDVNLELEDEKSPSALLQIASLNGLPAKSVRALSVYLDESSELFKDSLFVDFGSQTLLDTFSRNANRAIGGVTEATGRLSYAKSTDARIRSRQAR